MEFHSVGLFRPTRWDANAILRSVHMFELISTFVSQGWLDTLQRLNECLWVNQYGFTGFEMTPDKIHMEGVKTEEKLTFQDYARETLQRFMHCWLAYLSLGAKIHRQR